MENETSISQSLTLEQAKEKLERLLAEAESNAWEIGDLLNTVEKQGLARSKGFGKTRTWLEKEIRGAEGKTTTLYRYANVAAVYTHKDVDLWKISKLELLMAHDKDVLGHSNSEDPANREVQLVQPDGSTVTRKFHDCSYRDLLQSHQRRRKAVPPRQKKASARQSDVRALKKSSGTANDQTSSHPEEHSFRVAFAMLALGVVVCVISQILPLGLISAWVFVAGAACFLGGIGMLIRRWHNFREHLIAAVKEGKTLEFLTEHLHKANRAIRSRIKPTKVPTTSPEETPPTEKKAA
jgi:hypothetical protein